MSNPKLDGIRECPRNDQHEQPNHMTAILKKLFPDVEWRHGRSVVNDQGNIICRKKPDFLSVEKHLIIEIDGDSRGGRFGGHFRSNEKAENDISNTKFYENNGYRVIRIPFYVQLDAEMISFYFGIDYKEKLYPAANEHGFAHSEALLPAEFCKLGIERFKKDIETLPKNVVSKIKDTLKDRIAEYETKGYTHEESVAKVLPPCLFNIIK